MSSFGGETPINVVNVDGQNAVPNIYTVPSGKYFKGFLYTAAIGGITDIRIDSFVIDSSPSGETAYELVLHSGDVLTLTGISTDTAATLKGVLYNNP